ncbi:phosphoribosylglycinamide formyltransferase [Paenibacillus sp. CC-CFT747]|nr:phosphoribosylglycinamide formyltransferase [Paenibacillus sp. CC-CFT747]
MKPYRIAVLASGSGSNFQAIVDAVAAGKLDVRVELLVCDRPQAPVVEKARRAGVPVFAFRPKEYPSREAYETEIVRQLQERGVDLVVMAGYMRLITDTLLAPYAGRIVNVHPSLLPAFPGMDAVGQALAYGAKVAGITVHFVDGGMDTGPIIAQRAVEIQEDDTAETLALRLHRIEHELYPEVIGWLRAGRAVLEENGRRVRIH